MLLNNYTFKGSYLIILKNYTVENLSDYQKKSIGEYNIYYSKEVYVNEITHKNSTAILIGYCFDIRKHDLSEEEVLKHIIQAEDKSEELEYVNGRYNLIIRNDNGFELYSDASQLQPLVYHKESKTLASHDLLLYEALRTNGVQNMEKVSERQTELDFTRFENIYKYNPSLKLDLKAFIFERIYPREELVTKTVDEVIEEIKPYFNESISWLKNQPNEKFLTITG